MYYQQWHGKWKQAEANEKMERDGTSNARDETVAKELATMYPKCTAEQHIRKTGKEAKSELFCIQRQHTRHQELQTNLLAE